ncbi:MAG: tRNA epoxyqueuosine(34) reductase QueG [Planctomycetes bacterium]|nr:tRNA epoxyqueuosine(34) reductase QueG [Planctomycetota bacterium]
MRISPAIVRELALEQGFDLVGFGPADPGPHAERFLAWLDAGRHGDMHWLARDADKITRPESWIPGPRSTIALARDYGGPPGALPGGGRVARYAMARDYHRTLGRATRTLREQLEAEGVPRGAIKVGPDAVPLLERALALRAGIGFLAKSAGVISPTRGPYLLLSELITPLELPFDDPAAGTCGTCTRCIEACPTGAIVAPHEVDARRCLSYTTIELRGSIPAELREPQGDWLFGCDVCLEVCPFTGRGRAAGGTGVRPADLRPHPALESYTLLGVLELDAAAWDADWTGTPLRRANRNGLRRNAAVVLGNLRDESALPALVRALADPDPLVREHVAWAIGRVAPREPALESALGRETDSTVRRALRDALERR